jgi:hypothetical protein
MYNRGSIPGKSDILLVAVVSRPVLETMGRPERENKNDKGEETV